MSVCDDYMGSHLKSLSWCIVQGLPFLFLVRFASCVTKKDVALKCLYPQ